ncbi:hypothetical protein [Parasediminibacterium sp. JCM 36343]|uniref:hypothetical protein n=1 Tax=Parasediminibacterium sp. JCM 36343 TaxID=3374279 RepID=UPI00397C87A2
MEVIKDTEVLKDRLEDITENLTDIIDTYYHLTVLKVADRAATTLSIFFLYLVLMAIALFVVLFASIGLAVYFNRVLHTDMEGYFVVAGMYTLIGLVLMIFRKTTIFGIVRNVLIRKLYE